MHKLRANGYRIHLFFLMVSSIEVALSRIKERVVKGCHDVPEAVVRRRFDRSFRNFLCEYRNAAHSWYLLDNTSTTPATVAFKEGEKPRIIDERTYESLLMRYAEQL